MFLSYLKQQQPDLQVCLELRYMYQGRLYARPPDPGTRFGGHTDVPSSTEAGSGEDVTPVAHCGSKQVGFGLSAHTWLSKRYSN
ncbi:hypothetical protein M3J09_007191 [Ascochyta lentis]